MSTTELTELQTQVSVESSMHMTACLNVLAERVAALVESMREEGDVDDSQRGVTFPRELIVRDARRAPDEPWPVISPGLIPPRLTELGRRCGLSDLELEIILIAVATSIQPRFEHFFIVLNNEVETRGPTVATALKLAGRSPADASARATFRSDRTLLGWGLLQVTSLSRSLMTQVITAPERTVAYLLGDDTPDPDALHVLDVVTDPVVTSSLLPPIQTEVPAQLILRGRAGCAAVQQLMHLARNAEFRGVALLPADRIPKEPADATQLLRTCIREAAMNHLVLAIDARAADPVAGLPGLIDDLDRTGAPFAVLAAPRSVLGHYESVAIDLPVPDVHTRTAWWNQLRPDHDPWVPRTNAHIEPEDIASTSPASRPSNLARGGGERIRRIEPAFRLGDVILDSDHRRQLTSVLDRARYRSLVLTEMGLKPGGMRGKGVTALFTGPPGTGKTMAAEALAGELGVPLLVVELASVVDKYIGETEKNLEAVFRAVEQEDGVLLFDEADALFGKRSEVSEAKDRYANIEVAYLLQRMESFDGLAILTTNMKANLDVAFTRRLDAIIEFAEPEADERRRLWLEAFQRAGRELSADELDTVSTLPLAGGAIRSIAVTAAFAAAAQSTVIDKPALLDAIRDEWRKTGRLAFENRRFETWERS